MADVSRLVSFFLMPNKNSSLVCQKRFLVVATPCIGLTVIAFFFTLRLGFQENYLPKGSVQALVEEILRDANARDMQHITIAKFDAGVLDKDILICHLMYDRHLFPEWYVTHFPLEQVGKGMKIRFPPRRSPSLGEEMPFFAPDGDRISVPTRIVEEVEAQADYVIVLAPESWGGENDTHDSRRIHEEVSRLCLASERFESMGNIPYAFETRSNRSEWAALGRFDRSLTASSQTKRNGLLVLRSVDDRSAIASESR